MNILNNSIFLSVAICAMSLNCLSSRAQRFNDQAADESSRPDEIIQNLNIQSGQNVCDIGSGGGYFAMRFSRIVGNTGKVYAVDVNEEFLDFVKAESTRQNIQNIKTVLARETDTMLPELACDLIFMRDVYHHISHRTEYFRLLGSRLKPEGRIAIIDYHTNGFFFNLIMHNHMTDRTVILEEMKNAGFNPLKEFDFLPRQNFIIFQKMK